MRYAVADAEVLDADGNRTGQTDLVVYDSSTTRPLRTYTTGTVLLPAEALLATVEVKSRLPAEGRAARADDERGALGLWFFSLVNFLAR